MCALAALMVRAFACFSAVALFTTIGCAAQTDGASDTDDALGNDGPPPREVACTQPCTSRLHEDPVITCYRHVSATINGHTGTLFDQLVQASGAQSSHMRSRGKNYCGGRGVDCGGTFWDHAGHTTHVMAFNSAT